mmetsp:Transcript_684/g.1418  ORF Transcript_684/g.1418 Transcript_684/m.1418 type:complete len:225 (-) Transcript_684:982-1656(-)|eukprot:CAMPEP_0184687588 /NCGR_PEP_ID=MMETSP0312-20130426/26948_1 /TAXON_ID=31354 /ORGANISM="Compsopogon coeruleus, Strain SAG 36.94" /LENGTH=224 /DNA_ID=CAMNT_0027143903 /DNA_START=50 /DNA_END=724 /DNA_ORIENTATION=-
MGVVQVLAVCLAVACFAEGTTYESKTKMAATYSEVSRSACPSIFCIALFCPNPEPSTFPSKYEQFQGTVFLAKVVKRLTNICVGSQHFYLVKVMSTFKGCPPTRKRVILELPCYDNALTIGVEYIVFGDLQSQPLRHNLHYQTNGCDGVYPTEPSSIEYANQRRNMEVCPTDGTCLNGEEQYFCIDDPCRAAPPCPLASSCRSSYCGGCNASFFDTQGILVPHC